MRRGIKGLLLGIAIGLFGSLFGLSPVGVSFERNVGLDWLFTARGAVAAPAEAVVIAIDGFTGDKLGIAELPREWPRSIHGELVDALVDGRDQRRPCGALRTLRRYERARRGHNTATQLAMDGFKHLFSNHSPLLAVLLE